MENILYLYKFNSYHNRVLKMFDTPNEYITYQSNNNNTYVLSQNVNFDLKDGATATVVYPTGVGIGYDLSPNYVLVLDSTNSTIKSRWYVVEGTKTRGGQYQLTLFRDVVADFKNDIITAPCLIEKATLRDSNPLIFNSENVSVNKIKTREYLLQDESKCAWVVGYLGPKYSGTTETAINDIIVDYNYNNKADFLSAFSTDGFDVYKYMAFDTNSQSLPTTESESLQLTTNAYLRYAYKKAGTTPTYNCVTVEFKNNVNTGNYLGNYFITDTGASTNPADVIPDNCISTHIPFNINTPNTHNIIVRNTGNAIASNSELMFNTIKSVSSKPYVSTISPFNGKIIKIGNEFYRCEVNKTPNGANMYAYDVKYTTQNTGVVIDAVKNAGWTSIDSTTYYSVVVGSHYEDYRLRMIKVDAGNINITLTGNETPCGRLPYKMFYIPYNRDGEIKIDYGSDTINMSGSLALTIGKMISTKYTGAQELYDLQLLPYCPEPSIIKGDKQLKCTPNAVYNTLVTDGDNNKIGVVFWATSNEQTFDIQLPIEVSNVKLESITDTYRLVSPNWNGQFEFNASKNGGVSYFNVDFTYKPHTPYIHINPNFGRLYGSDFNDARGLICQGDFSLPQTSDAWNTYELQNKNYQTQFDKQITYMENTHNLEMQQAGISSIFGAVSGAAAGAVAGSTIPFIGGIAGGIAGGALSLAGAATDMWYNQQKYEKQLAYTKDMHTLQLENIQALPQNLTNVGAMTYNNKLFPILEYYTCSDEEKSAVINYLYYYGMTVNAIGNMVEYMWETPTFISGQIIRLNIDEDNHIIEHIYNEIKKGVFI